MIWGDVVHAHPERIPEIDRDFVMLDWWYEAKHDYERVKRFAENGLDFVVCPGTSTWNSLFPRVSNSDENIARYADAGRRHGAGGLLVTDWGDFGHYNLQGNSWLAYAWAAQQAWSGATSRAAFDRGFARVVFGDTSGETARLYRELGAVHDPGFSIFNGSPLLYLYFDDLEAAYFVDATVPGALRQCLQRLDRLAVRLEAAADRFARERATFDELRYAVAASRFALRKAQRGRAYVAWRRRPPILDAAGRRSLARALSELADEQAALGRTLRQLWLRRSRPGGFDLVKRRLDRSVRSLRRAARALRNNRPPAAPPPHPGFDTKRVQAAILASCRGR
jgi:hypothetical protein